MVGGMCNEKPQMNADEYRYLLMLAKSLLIFEFS